MSNIVLFTITARYSHSAFGLRWLRANLGKYREQTQIVEFHLKQSPSMIAETLIAMRPQILGAGVYIWNLREITEVIQIVKRVLPETVVIIGGPEVSFDYEELEIFKEADYLVRGEGELSLPVLIGALLEGSAPVDRVWSKKVENLDILALPYDEYTERDLTNRIIYVESSRGCPFHCEFCLSAIEPGVRFFNREKFLKEMEKLIARGAKNFTFVDRTFNINETHALEILEFFLKRVDDSYRLHFEIVPDRLSRKVLERLKYFPRGVLHLEVGVQSVSPETLKLISRNQDIARTKEAIEYLLSETGAEVHADLVAGMPGETWESFRDGFNFLVRLSPQEIQLGILKKLRGALISRHIEDYKLSFAPFPPYEILQTNTMTYEELQKLKRMARYLELFYNQGNFPNTIKYLWQASVTPFDSLAEFSEFVWSRTGKTHELSLVTQANLLFSYLMGSGKFSKEELEQSIRKDYASKPGRTEKLSLSVQ
ncbi:MAG: B12-binding domain-containing radical SAM protein [Candidatus Hydrogenedentes bacterium]|nr:B12-binding domain-containing radical SAM protein [Candidatus Hydrogenedentota bacterium]